MQQSQREETQMGKTILYRRIRSGLTILCILLLTVVLVTPGVLRLLYRADSKVALEHAKSVRMAMQAAGAGVPVSGKRVYGLVRRGCGEDL